MQKRVFVFVCAWQKEKDTRIMIKIKMKKISKSNSWNILSGLQLSNNAYGDFVSSFIDFVSLLKMKQASILPVCDWWFLDYWKFVEQTLCHASTRFHLGGECMSVWSAILIFRIPRQLEVVRWNFRAASCERGQTEWKECKTVVC